MKIARRLPADRNEAWIKPINISIWLVKCLLVPALSVVVPAHAQISTANVIGTVQDSTSANIRDANVKLINSQTGTENDSRTNGAGEFVLPGVLPGSYIVQIECDGFATTRLNGITLNIGDTKKLLIRMKVGPVTESASVDASGLTLNASDASVSTVVDRKFIANIPLDGRSFQDLISMTPGVVTQSPQAAGSGANEQGDFSVNGQRLEANSFFVDGVAGNITLGLTANSSITTKGSSSGSTALGTTQSLVSIDALQEFRVLSSTYSAEYGRTPGGQFTFLTRSGTNALHGSLYTYWRDYLVNGADWFTFGLFTPQYQPNPPKFSQNDFGGTLSGPVAFSTISHSQDKTFFFASYEGLLLAQATPPTLDFVPSQLIRQDAAPALRNVLNYFPYGSAFNDINLGGQIGLDAVTLFGYSLPARLNSTSIRLDHSISSKLSLFARYGDTPSYSQTQQLSSLTINRAHTQSLTLGATAQISSTKSNDIRLGLAESNSKVLTQTGFATGGIPLGLPGLNTELGIPDSASSFNADVYIHLAGAGDSEITTDSSNSSLHQWNLRDTFNLQAANHLFKFGIDYLHIAATSNPAALSVQTDFLTDQSLEDNLASDIVVTRKLPSMPVLDEFSGFAQDEWHASEALTLSMGLRWEVNPAPRGRHGADPFTAIGSVDSPQTLSLAPRGSPLWHTSWFDLAPRFGAAWKLRGDPGNEWILRAGAGVFFDTANRQALEAFSALGFTSTAYYANAPIPLTAAQLASPNTPSETHTDSKVFAFPRGLQLPYSLQWNVGIEKALGRNQALTISYIGARGDRLLQEQRRNVNALNHQFGDVSFFPKGLTSNYQSLQLRFQRSISPGLQALASYTWAHSQDFGSTGPLYPLARGNSELDVRHNLEAALSWSAPKPRGSFLRRQLLGGWGLDGRLIARTAFPITLFGNLFSEQFTGARYYNGVDLIPNRPMYLYRSDYPGGRILNAGPYASASAFRLPDGTGEGNAPRNAVRGFDLVQINAAFQREIHIYDRLNVEFQAEAFNVLNHPSFGYVDPFLSDALFGQGTKMLNQSFGPTGALYQQGGPRSVQLAFKLKF